VARAIVASRSPVITGVGHETDFTIADFAADLRAPTPTAAAELATPDQIELKSSLTEAVERSLRTISTHLASSHWELDAQTNRLRLFSPLARIRSDRQYLDDLTRRAGIVLTHWLELQRSGWAGINQRLSALNPQSVLSRGYAVVSTPDGQMIHHVTQVVAGDDLDVRVSDGTFGVRVNPLSGEGQ